MVGFALIMTFLGTCMCLRNAIVSPNTRGLHIGLAVFNACLFITTFINYMSKW